MSADHYRLLFEYNRWANQRVIDCCRQVAAEDYVAKVAGLSFGSLHATLVHAYMAEMVWYARFLGVLPPEALKDARISDRIAETEIASYEALVTAWQTTEAQLRKFVEALTDEDIERPLSYVNQYDEPNTQPLWQLLSHLVNHGTQFRAEAAVRLTQLGLSPGDLDLIVWLRSLGGPVA